MVISPLPKTFNQKFEDTVHRFPDQTAFRLKTPEGYRTYSYREAYRQSRAVAQSLIALGLQQGARVAILSENRPEWVVAYLGIYLAKMIAVPLDTQITQREWRRLLEDSQSQVVFVSGLLLPDLKEAVKNSLPLLRIICFDSLDGDRDARNEISGLIEWAEGLTPPPVLPECRPGDVVTIIYTSGTTGTPKGVMLTQSNIISELTSILSCVHADERDILLCLLPLQHVLASVVNVMLPLYMGGQVVFADTLKRAEILLALEQAGITILATVPQFFYLFYERIQEELANKPVVARLLFRTMLRINRLSLSWLHINLGRLFFGRIHRSFGATLRMFVSGGSSIDPRVAQDFHDMGFLILQGYGLTETTGACTVTRVENIVIGSVGPPLAGMEIGIDKPDAAGVGEILIRGGVVMAGYYKNPQATAEAIRDGWFCSGDLGRVDSKNNLFITGRKKEVIVLPNGKNIYPDEIEAHYSQSPFIQEIAVVGIKESGGHETSERLHAVVVPNFDFLKAKKIANAKEILRDEIGGLSNQLPHYKRLMSYQIQKDPLPRTTSRKIKRLELKSLIEAGQLGGMESSTVPAAISLEDRALQESAVGQEVLGCLRETYHRDMPITPNMNLELDLGFDSMERVELLASLEQILNLRLPEEFGAEILSVRDLISRLAALAGISSGGGAVFRQSWQHILSEESLALEEKWKVRLTGHLISLFKYSCLRLIYWSLFRVFLRLETRGLQNIPAKGPYLLCPNHLSYIDAFIVMSVLPYRLFRRFFFVGYSEFFASWFMKLLARLANIVPVDPDAHLLRAMRAGAYGLRRGHILCIFPEGGRSFDGNLQEFKKGAAILAHEIGVPIVPVGIRGTYEVWARSSYRIRPHKVILSFGQPLEPGQRASADPYQAEIEALRAAVVKLI
jgi:long-chain acyl-CoA synthetase